MQISRVMKIAYFLTLPLIAIAAVPPLHLGQVGQLTASREIGNGSAAETRLRRAVFDLIPATGHNLIPATGDRRRQREKGRLCREGRQCEPTRKSLDLGNRRGTFASYRKFIGRHSKAQRRSRRKLKKLFMDWLKEEREKVVKEGGETH